MCDAGAPPASLLTAPGQMGIIGRALPLCCSVVTLAARLLLKRLNREAAGRTLASTTRPSHPMAQWCHQWRSSEFTAEGRVNDKPRYTRPAKADARLCNGRPKPASARSGGGPGRERAVHLRSTACAPNRRRHCSSSIVPLAQHSNCARLARWPHCARRPPCSSARAAACCSRVSRFTLCRPSPFRRPRARPPAPHPPTHPPDSWVPPAASRTPRWGSTRASGDSARTTPR
jgi:hypothetical protein